MLAVARDGARVPVGFTGPLDGLGVELG
jgi:hypothetical protein